MTCHGPGGGCSASPRIDRQPRQVGGTRTEAADHAGARSVASTRPLGPTARAASRALDPRPQPRSRTRSPWLGRGAVDQERRRRARRSRRPPGRRSRRHGRRRRRCRPCGLPRWARSSTHCDRWVCRGSRSPSTRRTTRTVRDRRFPRCLRGCRDRTTTRPRRRRQPGEPVVPEEPDPQGVQVLRLLDDAAARAGHHLHRRAQRLGQVQRRRRAGLGDGRAGRQVAARRQDGGRHLRRHLRPPAAGPRRGAADDRQLRRRAADRLRRGHDQPDHVPQRRLGVRHQRHDRAGCSTSRSCCRDSGIGREMHVDRRPGPARHRSCTRPRRTGAASSRRPPASSSTASARRRRSASSTPSRAT